MTTEKFCLRWNDFENNISSAFRELRDDKDFFDVTLACDDEQILAHKVILSACSPFFRNVLRRNPHQHPLLYLKGVKYTDLQSVLNFMYQGEVSVAQEELNSFLSVAEDLRVKGLTQNQSENNQRESNPKPSLVHKPNPRPPERSYDPPPKRSRLAPFTPASNPAHTHTPAADDEDIQEVVPVKSEPRDPAPHPVVPATPDPYPAQPSYDHTSQALATPDDQTMAYQEENYEDYQYEEQEQEQGYQQEQIVADGGDPMEQLKKYIVKRGDGPERECGICYQYSNKSSTNVRNHIESKHFPGMMSYQCEYCKKICKTKQSLDTHRQRCTWNENSKTQM